MADDRIELLATPIDVAGAVQFISHPDAGGIAVFLGTTRSDTSLEGRTLAALDYEAYDSMALAQLRDIAVRARERWPIIRLALLQRVGRVELAAPSVLVA